MWEGHLQQRMLCDEMDGLGFGRATSSISSGPSWMWRRTFFATAGPNVSPAGAEITESVVTLLVTVQYQRKVPGLGTSG